MAKITAIAIESHDPAKNAQFYKKLFDFNEIAENDRLRRGGEAPQIAVLVRSWNRSKPSLG